MTDSDLATLLCQHSDPGHGRWLAPDGVYMRCVCGEAMHPIDHPAHVASVLSGVYAITPLPEPPVRFGHRFIGADPECCCAGVGGGELCGYPKWEHTARAQETPQ